MQVLWLQYIEAIEYPKNEETIAMTQYKIFANFSCVLFLIIADKGIFSILFVKRSINSKLSLRRNSVPKETFEKSFATN